MTKELTILEVAEYLKNEDHFRTIQKGIGPTNQIVWRDFDEFEPHSFWIIQDFRWRFKPIKEEIDDLKERISIHEDLLRKNKNKLKLLNGVKDE